MANEKIVQVKYDNELYGLESGGYAIIELNKDSWSGSGPFYQFISSVATIDNVLTGSLASLTDTTTCVLGVYTPVSSTTNEINTLNRLWSSVYAAETVMSGTTIGINIYTKVKPDQSFYAVVKW